jgi:hypothetical protein
LTPFTRVEEQQREQGALLGRADVDGSPTLEHLEQPEEAELCAVLTGHWPAAGGWIKRQPTAI